MESRQRQRPLTKLFAATSLAAGGNGRIAAGRRRTGQGR